MSKTAIVTGASGNMGQAVVKKFLAEGYKVIGTSVPNDAASIDIDDKNFEKIVVDLLNEEAAEKMINEAKDKAKSEYDRIVADAQNAIDQQKNAALTDVKNSIGNMVIEITEKVIRRELVNRQEHEQYITKLANDLTTARN